MDSHLLSRVKPAFIGKASRVPHGMAIGSLFQWFQTFQ